MAGLPTGRECGILRGVIRKEARETMGKVLMIGGSPMTGKSTAAAAMGSVRRWPCLSTDDVGEVLQAALPLDPMRGMDYRDYYACVPEDGLIEDIRRYHRAMEPAARTARRYPQHLGRAARAGGVGPPLSRPCPALARRVGFRDLARRRGGAPGVAAACGAPVFWTAPRRRTICAVRSGTTAACLRSAGRWPCPSCRSGRRYAGGDSRAAGSPSPVRILGRLPAVFQSSNQPGRAE